MIEDASSLAHVHVQSWRETYGGMVPQSVLDEMSIAKRDAFWQHVLMAGETEVRVADVGGRVAGFASAGSAREPLETDAELYAIYVLAADQGRGLGRLLFAACANAMRERGHRTMGLWVLARNPSVRFYERLGGRVVTKRTDEWGLEEQAYAFAL